MNVRHFQIEGKEVPACIADSNTSIEDLQRIHPAFTIVQFAGEPSFQQLDALPETVSIVLLDKPYSSCLLWEGTIKAFYYLNAIDNNFHLSHHSRKVERNPKRKAEFDLVSEDASKFARKDEKEAEPEKSDISSIPPQEHSLEHLYQVCIALSQEGEGLRQENALLKAKQVGMATYLNQFNTNIKYQFGLFSNKIKELEARVSQSQIPQITQTPEMNTFTFPFSSSKK